MKIKLFTKNIRSDILREIHNPGRRFTAEEHSLATRQEFSEQFQSHESLLRYYLSQNVDKLHPLAMLAQHLNGLRLKKVLSLGAGPCVLEYLLKFALPVDSKVVATDFDAFFIDRAKALLPGIVPLRFDFCRDSLDVLRAGSDGGFDAAVFFGSAYVMDDPEFVRLFGGLRALGIRQILDFHAGYMAWKDMALHLLAPLRESPAMRSFCRRPPLNRDIPAKFHGYCRSRGELRRLYRQAGLMLVEEHYSVGAYKYVAVCDS